MDTSKKIYRDSVEIDRAWDELIESIKPLNVTKFNQGTNAVIQTLSEKKKKKLHHPALITPDDLGKWEFFG